MPATSNRPTPTTEDSPNTHQHAQRRSGDQENWENAKIVGRSGGAEVVGALRMTLLLGPMVNKTPNNVVCYFMILVVFSFWIMGIILDWLWVFNWWNLNFLNSPWLKKNLNFDAAEWRISAIFLRNIFCLMDLGPQNSVEHLGPLGRALPHPPPAPPLVGREQRWTQRKYLEGIEYTVSIFWKKLTCFLIVVGSNNVLISWIWVFGLLISLETSYACSYKTLTATWNCYHSLSSPCNLFIMYFYYVYYSEVF